MGKRGFFLLVKAAGGREADYSLYMKTYLHLCIFHEQNSLKMYWNVYLSTNIVQKREFWD